MTIQQKDYDPALAQGAANTVAAPQTITAATAQALAVGANGATNPVFSVNTNTASVATGLTVIGAAAASGVALNVISSGTDENITISPKGNGLAQVNGLVKPVLQSALVGATVVLTVAQSGSVCYNRSTSGSPSWTLPAATIAGLNYTFVCANTTAGFTVTGAQVIHFKTSASGTVLTSTTTLTNTQATAIVGDFISIASDGAVWWMTGISGIFAAS